MNELVTLGIGLIAGAAEKNAAMKDKNLREASFDEALRLQQQANILKEKQLAESKKGGEIGGPDLKNSQQNQRAESVPLPPDGPSARDTLMKIADLNSGGKGNSAKDNFPIGRPTTPGLERRKSPTRFTPLPKHIASPPVSRSPGPLK